jgi:hypothetical protein
MTTATRRSTIQRHSAREVDPPVRPVRTTYRYLRMQGLSPVEAGNVAGLAVGLRPQSTGWTATEIERLLFLRWRVRSAERR